MKFRYTGVSDLYLTNGVIYEIVDFDINEDTDEFDPVFNTNILSRNIQIITYKKEFINIYKQRKQIIKNILK